MPNAYNLHFNHVPHVTTSPGLGDPETAYCTEMVLEKSPFHSSVLWGRRYPLVAPWLHRPLLFVASSKTWNRAEFGLTFSTASILRGRQAAGKFFSSVYWQFTRYLLGCFGHHVCLLEVLVAGSAAQPGLPKVDPTGEKEAAGPRFDTTLQQSPDFTPAGQATVAGEQGVLLTKHPSGADLDHCCP